MTQIPKLPVLVIDDEADLRDLIEMTLIKMGLSVDTADGVTQAKEKLSKNSYALVLTDMRMPDGNGLDVVEFININNLDVPVAVITAYGNADTAVAALKAGAFDYLQKPITLAQLRTLVKSAIKVDEPQLNTPVKSTIIEPMPEAKIVEEKKTETPNTHIDDSFFHLDLSLLDEHKVTHKTSETEPKKSFLFQSTPDAVKLTQTHVEKIKDNTLPRAKNLSTEAEAMVTPRLIGQAIAMQEVRQMIIKLSNTLAPIYISGESGTGKEQAARSIHELSSRKNKAFVAVNCGAIPENLMESEFFGYRKGSFTGADTDRTGFFQNADGGSLFLDEVADLPLAMQVKLLRAIQEKSIRRIGDSKESTVDVRILCATHKDLAKEVAAGRFRQDLYYRLNVITLKMPPLRELSEDLPNLINNLLKKFSNDRAIALAPSALKALLGYSYPGNFRELENILERAVALASRNRIEADDLQISSHLPVKNSTVLNNNETETTESGEPNQTHTLAGNETLQDYLDRVEREIILKSLESTRYNRTQAAKTLGVSFRSMRYRMERLGIE